MLTLGSALRPRYVGMAWFGWGGIGLGIPQSGGSWSPEPVSIKTPRVFASGAGEGIGCIGFWHIAEDGQQARVSRLPGSVGTPAQAVGMS